MAVRSLTVAACLFVLAAASAAGPVAACGGFFCTTVPVDQAAERVVFTMDEGSITTYVQINYVGAAEDFAWILPVPTVPRVETAEMAMFRDLERLTRPIYIAPRPPDCLVRRMPLPAPAAARAAEGATVLASGEVGPFGYHVVTSPDHQELVRWLRDNGYRITPEMEPLVKVYTDEGLVFLAMRLRQGQNARDIVPVKLTYESSLPMIPLRLTAVAATPDMPVVVWIFARAQVAPLNYASIRIADSEVSFRPFGGHDYPQVVSRAVDQAGGRAFVTEFAGPTTAVRPPTDESVKLLFQQYPYMTRLYTEISPEEMTADPVFDLSPGAADVSNVHDLSDRPAPWTCDDGPGTLRPVAGSGPPPAMMAGGRYLQSLGLGGGPKGLHLFALVAGTALLLLRRRPAAAAVIGTASGSARRRIRSWLAGWELTPRATALLFFETVALQGVHEIEHVVQVVQRTVLGVGNGAGVLGSVFDIEPVHMVYNAAFLVLLGAVYVGCRRHRSAIPARGALVLSLLGLAVALQSYHTVEHVVKMWQYVATGLNGTPGILGHWIPVVYLHFAYNTLIYLPVLAAFFLGGFHRSVARELATLLPRRRRIGLQRASGL
jgi:hypothetical protein